MLRRHASGHDTDLGRVQVDGGGGRRLCALGVEQMDDQLVSQTNREKAPQTALSLRVVLLLPPSELRSAEFHQGGRSVAAPSLLTDLRSQ